MSTGGTSKRPGFSELVFSDLQRFRPGGRRTWLAVLARCVTVPGMLASIVVRAQQCLHRAGHPRLAGALRTVSTVLLGADFGPGMSIGTGLMLVHPIGVNIGYGLVIGDNVTFAGGVTAAAKHYLPGKPQEFATICDGATIGAHAVLVGGVRIGRNAVVFGSPARQIGTNDTSG